MHSREQYLEEVRKEYVRANRQGRSKLLNEARRRTRLNRKYLIRILNAAEAAERKPARRRTRSRSYGVAVQSSLVEVWEIFDYPCGQRLEPALKQEVERLRELGPRRHVTRVAENRLRFLQQALAKPPLLGTELRNAKELRERRWRFG